MAKITLDNIGHRYPGSEEFALAAVDQVWSDGGAYALLGPSGCGKTTLLNIISGLLTPSQGRVLFGEQDVTSQTPEHRNIAQVFQFPVVYDTMTVEQNLAFPLQNRNIDAATIRDRVATAISLLGLDQLANRKAYSLTADEKQKISLGRGLVRTDVNAILFDEPLTVIDPQLKWQLRTELKKIHQLNKQTMIYVTHDQTEAMTFADKVAVMYDGKIVQVGTPQELFERPAHLFVGEFIGSPGMNILPCEVAENSVQLASYSIPKAVDPKYLGQELTLGIRPEYVDLKGPEVAGGLDVEILAVENLGRHRIVRARWESTAVNAILGEFDQLPPQARMHFRVDNVNLYQDSVLLS